MTARQHNIFYFEKLSKKFLVLLMRCSFGSSPKLSTNRRCSEKNPRTNRCSPVFFSLMISKQSCELSRHGHRTNIPTFVSLCSGYLWCLTESQIKTSERDPMVKMFVKRCSWGTCDTGSRSRKRLQFIHCVCSLGMFVLLGVWGITLLSFFFRNRSIVPPHHPASQLSPPFWVWWKIIHTFLMLQSLYD